MILTRLNESLYSNLKFTYDKTTKSYVAGTGTETITIAPGFGPFEGYFRVVIEDTSGDIFRYSELSMDDKSMDQIVNEVSDIIKSVYSRFIHPKSISDIYHMRDRFRDELSNQLYRRF